MFPTSSCHASSSSTSSVVSRAYLLLTATLLTSAASAVFGSSWAFAWQHPFLVMIAGFLCLLAVLYAGGRDSPAAIPLVFAFAAIEGLSLGPLLAVYAAMPGGQGPHIIAEAAGTTAAIFAALTAYAALSRRDFSFMGGFLFVGLVLGLIASVANYWFRIPALNLTVAVVFALAFSGYILVDTSRLLSSGQRNPVLLVVGLYLDILNLFLALLRIFSALNERD